MDEKALRSSIIALLQRIAPEVSAEALDPKAPLRDQVDLDSIDWLNFLVALHNQFHVEIPESAYEKLRCVQDIEAYLTAHTGKS